MGEERGLLRNVSKQRTMDGCSSASSSSAEPLCQAELKATLFMAIYNEYKLSCYLGNVVDIMKSAKTRTNNNDANDTGMSA